MDYSPVYSADGTHRSRPMNRYNDLQTSDFIIACEGKEIAVHRVVLTAASVFLKKFLTADPNCGRINANNASYSAMDIVLRSLYENPQPGREFRAFHYNPGVITSVWEIAMHFQIEDMVSVATARLIQLMDADNGFRILQATLKHPHDAASKSLQRHLVRVAMPPTVTADNMAAWHATLKSHTWLQDALDDAARKAAPPRRPASIGTHRVGGLGENDVVEIDADDSISAVNAAGPSSAPAAAPFLSPASGGAGQQHISGLGVQRQPESTRPASAVSGDAPAAAVAAVAAAVVASSPSARERVDNIRQSYQQYLSVRAANSPQLHVKSRSASASAAVSLTPAAGITPSRDDIIAYADDGDDYNAEPTQLEQSASKLRSNLEAARSQLADLSKYAEHAKGREEIDPSRRVTTSGATTGAWRGQERSASTDSRRSAGAGVGVSQTRLARPPLKAAEVEHDVVESEAAKALRVKIDQTKATYSQEMADWRRRRAQLEADMDGAEDSGVRESDARCEVLTSTIDSLRADGHSLRAAVKNTESERDDASQFIADSDVYCSAAKAALVELAEIVSSLPASGSSRNIIRKALAAAVVVAKDSRNAEKEALDAVSSKRAKTQEYLDLEIASVKRLQAILNDHEGELDDADANYEGFY